MEAILPKQDDRLQKTSPAWRRKLDQRYRRYAPHHPKISWKRWTVATLFLITLAAFFFDRPAIEWARTGPEWLRDFAADITDAGKSGWILVSAAVIGIGSHFLGRRLGARMHRFRAIRLVHASLYVFVSVAGSGLIANLAKRAIGRARPMHMDEMGTMGFQPFAHDYAFESFPSGHSTTDGALAMALAILFPAFRVPFLLLGFFLATTRTLVVAHYPSDVIGGFSLGAWFALMMAIVFARYGILFRTGLPGARAQ